MTSILQMFSLRVKRLVNVDVFADRGIEYPLVHTVRHHRYVADHIFSFLPHAVDAIQKLIVLPRHPIRFGQDNVLRGSQCPPLP